MNHSAAQHWQTAFADMPLIAILRGLEPSQALPTADLLMRAGFKMLEVPLNSPKPFDSITAIVKNFPQLLVGAGTVLTAVDVSRTVAAGGKLIVAPNYSPEVAVQAARENAIYLPGVATATEAFSALAAGAHGLKLFPAEMITPAVVKALRAVLPATTMLLPVGGITAQSMPSYHSAGANGFGLGSALFKSTMSAAQIEAAAKAFVLAVRDFD